MLQDIDELVNNDWAFDIDCQQGLPNQKPFTQEQAVEMARVIGNVYSISHAIHCEACGSKYS